MFIVYQKLLINPDGTRRSNEVYVSEDIDMEQFQNEMKRVGWVWKDDQLATRGQDRLFIHTTCSSYDEAFARRVQYLKMDEGVTSR